MSRTHRAAQLCSVFLLLVVVSTGRVAQGYNIGFNTLGGVNFDPFVGHSEGGFTVSPITGTWLKGHSFGDPVPSIFGETAALSTVRVTDNTTGLFRFDQVKLAGLTVGSTTYTVEGFLNNVSVLPSISGTLNIADTFFNIPNPSPSTIINRLDITLSRNSSSSFNVDNIVVHHIPEPSTIALLVACAIGVAARRSRRIGC